MISKVVCWCVDEGALMRRDSIMISSRGHDYIEGMQIDTQPVSRTGNNGKVECYVRARNVKLPVWRLIESPDLYVLIISYLHFICF